ncbi:hypothetical protein BHE90_016137 [Fusarium euwallaceae]|uniref:Uncharacterized protein n=1 Tax=Fusarium euwallaceae TaxID=1147111 RepID=A0A430L174_9HYPO|nr:hypothetical protein BHE90_016137 [Fusarium euwallaceae]
MSNDEAYLRVPNHREGRGLRKRKSDTILSPGRSKSPRQAKADENERADDNRRTDGGVDDTLPAKSLQSAPPSNDEHLVSEEPEQDGSQTRLEVDDEPRDDGDMDQLMASLKDLKFENMDRRKKAIKFVKQNRDKTWCPICQKFRHTASGCCIECREPICDSERA